MTVHFFPKGDIRSSTARYRGYLLADALEKAGFEIVVHRPPTWRPAFKLSLNRLKEFIGHFKVLAGLKKGDVVYLVRTVYQIDFLLLVLFLKIFLNKRVIFDFDDPIFLRRRMKTKMKLLTSLADAVFAGSHYLADWAGKYNRNVHLIPTSVPLEIYEKYSHEKSASTFIIGWVGIGPNHYDNFQLLAPVFKRLIEQRVAFKFVLIGSLGNQKIHQLFKGIKGLEVEFVDDLNWENPENVAGQIGRFDIGVMPLLDTPANRGKCAFKAVEYMSCCVPTIISPVGENRYLIKDGVNGYLAETTEEWVGKIKSLHENHSLARSLGVQGQETIRQHYSYQAQVPKIARIIKELIG